MLEIGADQGIALTAAAEAALPGWSCRIEPDLSGSPRVCVLDRPRG